MFSFLKYQNGHSWVEMGFNSQEYHNDIFIKIELMPIMRIKEIMHFHLMILLHSKSDLNGERGKQAGQVLLLVR